jgi:hypothetical protein
VKPGWLRPRRPDIRSLASAKTYRIEPPRGSRFGTYEPVAISGSSRRFGLFPRIDYDDPGWQSLPTLGLESTHLMRPWIDGEIGELAVT